MKRGAAATFLLVLLVGCSSASSESVEPNAATSTVTHSDAPDTTAIASNTDVGSTTITSVATTIAAPSSEATTGPTVQGSTSTGSTAPASTATASTAPSTAASTPPSARDLALECVQLFDGSSQVFLDAFDVMETALGGLTIEQFRDLPTEEVDQVLADMEQVHGYQSFATVRDDLGCAEMELTLSMSLCSELETAVDDSTVAPELAEDWLEAFACP